MLNLTRISTRDSIFPIRPSGRLRSSTDTHRQDIDDTHMIRHACSLHAVTQFALVIECPVCGRLEALGERATRGGAGRVDAAGPSMHDSQGRQQARPHAMFLPVPPLCRLSLAVI